MTRFSAKEVALMVAITAECNPDEYDGDARAVILKARNHATIRDGEVDVPPFKVSRR